MLPGHFRFIRKESCTDLTKGEDLSREQGVGSLFGVECTCRNGDKTLGAILRRVFKNKMAQPPCKDCRDRGAGAGCVTERP